MDYDPCLVLKLPQSFSLLYFLFIRTENEHLCINLQKDGKLPENKKMDPERNYSITHEFNNFKSNSNESKETIMMIS